MSNEELFKLNGYCVVKNAISKELSDFVTQYVLFDEMQDFSPEKMQGRDQVPNAHSKYADPAMETMLLNLHCVMEENTGLQLHPTYSYYRIYRPGDDLKIHIDRPSCEISCTLCFNYNYSSSDYEWPIFINDHPVVLNSSDLAIYRGCELDHWRNELKGDEETWHVQGFFHYVDVNGPFADWKYDHRPSIGAFKPLPNTKSYIQYL